MHSQGDGCAIQTCTQRSIGTNQNYGQALDSVQNSRPNSNSNQYGRHGSNRGGRGKRDTGYGAQNQVIEHGKVIIMPPLGKAPPNFPQPGLIHSFFLKHQKNFKLNFILILVIVIGLILWVVV